MKKILFIAFCVLIACAQQKTLKNIQTDEKPSPKLSASTDIPNVLKVKNYTPMSFLRLCSNTQSKIISILDTFPDNWVKRKDIDSLITFVKSKDRCFYLLSAFASSMPRDSAELGGYAIKFIRSYKYGERIKVGHHLCPKVDEKEADELIKWWMVERNKNDDNKKQ